MSRALRVLCVNRFQTGLERFPRIGALSIPITEYESDHYAVPKPNWREANKF